MRPAPAALVLAAAVLSSACGWLRGPDVVLLTVDTLRADHVGAHNPDSPAATPHMDALAADGVVYTQAWSPISVTGPAFATLHTGQEPGTHGVVLNLFRGGPALGPEANTLAESLETADYRTGAFVSGFTLRRALGLRQGFQRYDTPKPGERRRPGNKTTRAALRWMADQPRHQRMFLWWHSYDPHGPLEPYDDAAPLTDDWTRDPALAEHIPTYQLLDGVSDPDLYARRYAAAVTFADAQIGRLIADLKESGRYQHALIIVVADHGESFTERDLWFDHGTHASPEQLHVPLIIKYPRGRDAGTRVDDLVALADLAPTVLEQLNLPALPAADGVALSRSQRAEVVGESSHCKQATVSTCRPYGVAGKELSLRTAATSVVRRSTEDAAQWLVFDRTSDPGERRAPGQSADPYAVALLDELSAARTALGLAVPGGEGGLEAGSAEDEAEIEALRALGYVD